MNFAFKFYKPSVLACFQTHTLQISIAVSMVFAQSFHRWRIKLCPLVANDVEVRQEWVVAVIYRHWLSIPGPSLVSLLPSTGVGVTSWTNPSSQTAAVQRTAPGTAQTEKPRGLVLLTKFTLFKTEKPWVIYIVVCFEFIIWCLSKSKPDSFWCVCSLFLRLPSRRMLGDRYGDFPASSFICASEVTVSMECLKSKLNTVALEKLSERMSQNNCFHYGQQALVEYFSEVWVLF